MTPRWMLRIAAAALAVVSLFPALRQGWTHIETDFPNYYTAARLARQGAPLRNFYEWTWFQREIQRAGWGLQLGSYVPHPPLVMLPVLPLAGLAPMTAKRAWLVLNLLFLAAAIWMLAGMTRLPASAIVLLAAAGHSALAQNFVLGQYYVFVLFLLALSFWLLFRHRDFAAGLVLGVIFLLKLYAGPFLVYFLWKKKWRAAAGMLAASLVLAAVAIVLFGWHDNWYFVTGVLPRALAGEANDPYAPGLATPLSMIRHAFLFDPEVNPHPIANTPALVFFLQPLVTLSVFVFCLIAIPRRSAMNMNRELAWFTVMLVLLATNRSFYVGVLLLVPVVLLLEKANPRRTIVLIAAYLAMTISPPAAWDWLYPTTWVLLACYVALGIEYWRKLRPAVAAGAGLLVICAAGWSAQRRLDSFYREPPQRFARVLVEKDAVYSAAPAVSRDGVYYESIGPGKYVVNRWSAGKLDSFPFEGHAFHPSVAPRGGPVYFELAAADQSHLIRFDPETRAVQQLETAGLEATRPAVSPDGSQVAFIAGGRIAIDAQGSPHLLDVPGPVQDVAWFPDSRRLAYAAGPAGASQIFATAPLTQLTHGAGDHTEPAVSPDGRRLAFTLELGGRRQIWIQNLETGQARQLTEGICNSTSPAWAPDSSAVIFASDCQKGLGLPVLYRAPVAEK